MPWGHLASSLMWPIASPSLTGPTCTSHLWLNCEWGFLHCMCAHSVAEQARVQLLVLPLTKCTLGKLGFTHSLACDEWASSLFTITVLFLLFGPSLSSTIFTRELSSTCQYSWLIMKSCFCGPTGSVVCQVESRSGLCQQAVVTQQSESLLQNLDSKGNLFGGNAWKWFEENDAEFFQLSKMKPVLWNNNSGRRSALVFTGLENRKYLSPWISCEKVFLTCLITTGSPAAQPNARGGQLSEKWSLPDWHYGSPAGVTVSQFPTLLYH